ncbi:MAG: L-glutamate gamma-semialdehyde dehydrogenase [Actinobacteria bacterium]|nr:L-glutamate gamma-semialdehyde dehydrogenase [Actinomycetota bacterium]
MVDAVTRVPVPVNEPIKPYAPGSPERAELERELTRLRGHQLDLPSVIAGADVLAPGEPIAVREPHAHARILGWTRNCGTAEAAAAVAAAKQAAPAWRALSYDDRAAIFLRAAELLAGPWRATLNAATMLGQSKNVIQAEIDAACELIDFWRFNVHFGRQLLETQPISSPGVWNRSDHRPLEGFVYAITPFNFTAIAANLPTAPALMGNTVVWKPATTQQFSAHLLMRLLQEAGLPDGVINMVTGDGKAVSEVVLSDRDLAGIHFTGSTGVFQHLWREVGARIDTYRTYPRLVGETGGKDFVLAHPSADPAVLTTALLRGAFEYQGQKCSAASRAYVARSVWEKMDTEFLHLTSQLRFGDVASDLSLFMGAVIDDRSFARVTSAVDRAHADPTVTVAAGGSYDDSEGYFIAPTVLLGTDPSKEFFCDEYFGPVLSVHVYEDRDFDSMLKVVDQTSPYALTGSIVANDRQAVATAMESLRFSAGNFYINDKPTGAVVGQQPFGGGRASGTNDKAGALQNLLRWTSTRSIKETLSPPTDHRYPHMG